MFYIVAHLVGYKPLSALALGEPAADKRRADLENGYLDEFYLLYLLRRELALELGHEARLARGGAEGAHHEYVVIAVPLVKGGEHIRADDQKQLCVGIFLFYLAEGVIGVALTHAEQLRIGDRKPTVALKAQAAHLESVPAASKVQDVLVRRNRRRNNENAVELQLVRDGGNKPYVPHVRRIEGAAENAKSHISFSLKLSVFGVVRERRAAAYRDNLAEISRLGLENAHKEVLAPGEALAHKIIYGLAVDALVCRNAVGVDTQAARIVDRAVEVVFLRDDYRALDLEHVAGAVHRLIGREARMVEKHIVGVNAPADGVLLHMVDLVVGVPAVVAAGEYLFARAGLIQVNARAHSVLEHMAQSAVGVYPCAEHQYAVRLAPRRLVRADDILARAYHHGGVYRARGQHGERKQHAEDGNYYFFPGTRFFHGVSPERVDLYAAGSETEGGCCGVAAVDA